MFELGVLLAVLAVLGAVARRFALSPIPVYLLAGLSLGNGGILGVAAAGEFIATGAPIGVVLLLLALGLEFSATEFASSLRHHLPSAGVDIVLNATPGAVAGWLLGLDGVAILGLAGVTYISSSGVIARLLEDLRRLGNRETPAVLSVLVLEDFAMAAYLPLFAVLATDGSWLEAVVGMTVAIAALLGAFAASYRWGHHVGRLVTHPDSEQLLLRVLGITLIVAAVAESLHASAAVGAFLVGLTLTGETADRARMVLSRGEAVAPTATVRAMAPLSVYADDQLDSTGPGQAISQVTPFLVDLPVGEGNAVVRLSQIAHATESNPTAASLVDARTIVTLSGLAPATLHAMGVRVATSFSARLFNLLITNAPGTQSQMYIAGTKLLETYSVPPLLHNQALAISVTSYNGMLYFGINADRDAMSDVDLLPGLLSQALDELLEASR